MQPRSGGKVTSINAYLVAGWRSEPCQSCCGTGLVAYARQRDGPVTENERCRVCRGRGAWWLSPAGERHAYPGAPR